MQRLNQMRRHLSLAHTRGKMSLFGARGRGHMAHAPNASAVRGLGSLTILQLHVFCGYVRGAGFKHEKMHRG
jgi:hypothetical protein